MFLVICHVAGAAKYAAIGVVGDLSSLSVSLGVVSKTHDPLLVQDQPWEPRIDNGYPNVRLENTTWRLWYGDCLDDGCSNQVVCYAESADGMEWQKPTLGVYDLDFLKPELGVGTNNNIVLQGGGVGVYKSDQYVAFGDLCGGDEELPKCADGSIAANVAVSDDGVVWTALESIAWPAPQRYDCHNNLFLHEGQWVATTRNYIDDERMIAIQLSATDALDSFDTTVDPTTTMSLDKDHQLYSQITKFWYGVYLGFVMVYDSKDESTFGSGKVHCRLAYSTDPTRGWDWVDKDDDLIPLGIQGANATDPDNAFDSHVCFAAKPVTFGGVERIYYMGGNGPHSGERNSSLGLAVLRRDGFASVRGTGNFTTVDLKVAASTLRLTVDVFNDDAYVQLCQINDTRVDAERMQNNVTDAKVDDLDLSSYIGQYVHLTFQLHDAALYTLAFSDEDDTPDVDGPIFRLQT